MWILPKKVIKIIQTKVQCIIFLGNLVQMTTCHYNFKVQSYQDTITVSIIIHS